MLGPYRIGELLGAGGMGEVYRAQDTRLQRTVAIKTLKADFTERFQREARAISALNHPHVCTLYDVGSQNGTGYLVMEYVEGVPLKGPLKAQEALRLAIQIAGALEAAHEKGILHRDLKPGNILLSKGSVKLLDFGLAKFVATEPRSTEMTNTMPLTGAGQILGTLAYMSPEQIEGKPADARSDIFSFGLVLYELLTGRRAFQAASQAGLMAAILKDEPPPLTVPQPPIAAALDRTVKKCLSKDATRRWQTAADLRDELEWIAARESAAPPKTRRSLLPWIGATALLTTMAGIGWWTAQRSLRSVDHSLVRLSVDLGPDTIVGGHITAAISPDGTRLAFRAPGQDGKAQLATRLLDQQQTTLLAGTQGADDPFFSPDGQWIGFFAEGKMKKVSVRDSAVVTLCDATDGRGAAWGEDDNIIATLSSGTGAGLSRIPASGGMPQSITNPGEKGEATHRWPQILPGGQSILFMANKTLSHYDDSSIQVLSLRTGQIKVVQRGGYFGRYLPGGYLVFINNGTLFGVPFDLSRLEVRGTAKPLLDDVAADSNTAGGQFDFSNNGRFVYLSGKSATGTWTTMWLDGTGRIEPLLAAPGVYYEPRLSPDGKRLAFSSGTDIEIYDLGRETRARLTNATHSVNNSPVWTPDGKHIVFLSEGAARTSLQWIRADGSGVAQVLLESANKLDPYSFSPDGTRLAFTERNPATGADLWTLPLDIRDPEHPIASKPESFLQTAFQESSPAFSPDGHWISYSSSESGASEVFVRPFPVGSGKWLISNGGGHFPIWSRDGHELFYEGLDNRIMAAAYTAKGDAFVAGKPHPWSDTQLLDVVGHVNLDAAPDGRRFVIMPRPDRAGGPNRSVHVTFLLNFFEEVRRRIPAGK